MNGDTIHGDEEHWKSLVWDIFEVLLRHLSENVRDQWRFMLLELGG